MRTKIIAIVYLRNKIYSIGLSNLYLYNQKKFNSHNISSEQKNGLSWLSAGGYFHHLVSDRQGRVSFLLELKNCCIR